MIMELKCNVIISCGFQQNCISFIDNKDKISKIDTK